jgi:hypothetical protein
LAEEIQLAILLVGLEAGADLYCFFEAGQHLGSIATEPVESTGFYKGFDDLFIDGS